METRIIGNVFFIGVVSVVPVEKSSGRDGRRA